MNIYYIISARSFVAFHFGAFTYAVRGGFTLYYVPIYTLPPPCLATSTTAHDTQSQVDMAMPIGFIGSVLGAWSLGAQRRQTTNLAANCPTRVGPPCPCLQLLPCPRRDLSLALHLCHLLSCPLSLLVLSSDHLLCASSSEIYWPLSSRLDSSLLLVPASYVITHKGVIIFIKFTSVPLTVFSVPSVLAL